MSDFILNKPVFFSLDQIFSCGQAFRFEKTAPFTYAGVAFGQRVTFSENENDIAVNASGEQALAVWEDFLDLKRDYEGIANSFSHDPVMAEAIAFGSGIRILRQEFFESLITFILSQQNNIPRIKKNVKSLCEAFGEPLEAQYAFPSAERLASLSVEDIAALGVGFRAPYVLDGARRIASGELSEETLRAMPLDEARKTLMKIKGVGPKVADCTLLFGLSRFDAFPVDVWMDRAIRMFYGDGTFDKNRFGEYSGIAQQYLFYYARENKINKKALDN